MMLEQVVKALSQEVPLKDFHLRHRMKVGVTHLAELNKGRSLKWGASMNKYTIPVFARTIYQGQGLDIPAVELAEVIQQLVISDIKVDDQGVPHPDEGLLNANDNDVEAAMLEHLHLRLVERIKP